MYYKGDTVVYIDDGSRAGEETLVGKVGTIMGHIVGDLYFVRWEGFTEGHDADKKDGSKNCWATRAEQMQPYVKKPTIPDIVQVGSLLPGEMFTIGGVRLCMKVWAGGKKISTTRSSIVEFDTGFIVNTIPDSVFVSRYKPE